MTSVKENVTPTNTQTYQALDWPQNPFIAAATLKRKMLTYMYIHMYIYTVFSLFKMHILVTQLFFSSLQRNYFSSFCKRKRKGMPLPVPKKKALESKVCWVGVEGVSLLEAARVLSFKVPCLCRPGRCCSLKVPEFPLGCSLPKPANMNTGCVITAAGKRRSDLICQCRHIRQLLP